MFFQTSKFFLNNKISFFSITILHFSSYRSEEAKPLEIWGLSASKEGYFLVLDKYRPFQRGLFHSDCMINVMVPEGHYFFQVSVTDRCLKHPKGKLDCSSFIVWKCAISITSELLWEGSKEEELTINIKKFNLP